MKRHLAYKMKIKLTKSWTLPILTAFIPGNLLIKVEHSWEIDGLISWFMCSGHHHSDERIDIGRQIRRWLIRLHQHVQIPLELVDSSGAEKILTTLYCWWPRLDELTRHIGHGGWHHGRWGWRCSRCSRLAWPPSFPVVLNNLRSWFFDFQDVANYRASKILVLVMQ